MASSGAQFGALYLARFASSFGFVTLARRLPGYIDLFTPSGVATFLGVRSYSHGPRALAEW